MEEVKIDFNDKYGTTKEYILVQLDSRTPWMVRIVDHNNREYLEIRKMYWDKERDGLTFGKGARLPMDDDVAEDVLDAAATLLFEGNDFT